MIMNKEPYPISFELQASQALVCRYGEELRQYKMKPDIDVSGLSCLLQVAKPDGTFTENGVDVITEDDVCYLILTIPKQATVVKGVAKYSICCYGEIETEMHLLYSAEGPLWVDDDLITEEMIQSVAEVNGYTFPQDFFTVDMIPDMIPLIAAELLDDDNTSETTTWSSQKIDDEISQIDISVSETATGNPIEINDSAAAPLVKCVTQITGYQEGTGTPSPDNIRPIVAYTEGEIEVRGKNLAPSSPISRGQYVDGAFQNNNNRICSDYINILPNVIYTASIDRGNTENLAFINYAYFDKNKAYLGDRATNGESAFSGDKVHTFSISNSQVAYIRLTIRAYSSPDLNISDKTLDNAQLMIEEGSTATSYEPYTSTTHTTTYPSSIYRGSEDCVGGTATTEWGMIASYAGETLPGEWISDRDEYAPGTTPTTGAQVAYALATPTTSSVTPTNLPIKSLSGYNHIESSTGEMEVEYLTNYYQPIADIIELGDMHNYSTVEHVIGKWIDGKDLYEITLDITSPASINTNATVESLASLSFDKIVSLEGLIYASGVSQFVPIFWSYNTSIIGSVYIDGTNLKQIVSSAAYCNCREWITIRYTKTA